jgi:beta-lactamase regulating signal transducer with metallopeptidase domain
MEKEALSSAEKIADRLKLRSLPNFVFVGGKVPPLLWAFLGKTTIAIPAGLWGKLSSGEQHTLLAHELAHFRRRDHWYRWIEWLVMTAFWWHPLVWMARLGLRKAEEDSCDAWVLWSLPGSAKDYASAILKTLEFLSNKPAPMPTAACGFAERRSFTNVKDRFTTILNRKPSHRMNKKQKSFTIALAIIVLPLSGYLLQSQVTAKEGEGPTEAGIVEGQKEKKRQSEIQAMQESVEQRLVQLEK